MNTLSTAAEIKRLAAEMGADLCGTASAESLSGAPAGFAPTDVLPGCRSVIVIARRFLRSAVEAASTVPYTDIRNHLTAQMDILSIRISYALEDAGATAVPVNAIGPCEWDPARNRSMGIISLKHAAEKAGLGRIGRNTLLVNDRYGNMIWLGAVLTDRELEADPPIGYRTCPPGCRKCVDACPVGAIPAGPVPADESSSGENGGVVMDQKTCWDFAFGTPEKGGEWRIKCFACRASCPLKFGIPAEAGGRDLRPARSAFRPARSAFRPARSAFRPAQSDSN